MTKIKRRRKPVVKRRARHSPGKPDLAAFLRNNFYYLKPQQLIKTSALILCEAC